MNHADFLSGIAGVPAPARLRAYLALLAGQGSQILAPTERRDLHPLVVPLARDGAGAVVGLLCWPTAPPGFPLPVVRQSAVPALRWTLELLASSVDQALHRELVCRDARGEPVPESWASDPEGGEPLYRSGDLAASGLPLAVYRLTRVGETFAFFEDLISRHLEGGATMAALVTSDRLLRIAPGWARPMAVRARLLASLGEPEQARDSAAAALADPVWTLGLPFAEVATIAGWTSVSAEPFRRLAADVRKPPADRAAHLLDAIAVEGGAWSTERLALADLYRQAGLHSTARMVLDPT